MPRGKIELDDDQKFALMKFRRSVHDILQPQHDDHYLLRWLRARNWNPEAAEKMLRESYMFRKQWEIDSNLLTWDPPEILKLYHPSGTSGCDKDGAPVLIIPFQGFDPIGFLNSTPKLDLIKMAGKILETNLKMAAETGENQLVVIFDMEGFDIKQYASRPAAEIAISLIQLYEANYPEILKQCLIINAPRVFSIAFNVVKRFMHGYTLSKIQIFKNEPKKWKPVLLSNISPDNLPEHYGGTLRDPDGNPRYTTVIKPGGKIPKSFYKRNIETTDFSKEYIRTVLKKGNKLILDFLVVEEGCYLRWDFRTEGHDIKFGITLKDENGVESPVVRYKRVASNQIDESGVIACQSPATYFVTFDNTYSIFRNKKLVYRVWVTPPIEKLNIIPTEYDLKELKSSLEEELIASQAKSAGVSNGNVVISESSNM
ncbi:unnamed protein product [Psylliodes chrysocephalus]|uniref:SEC14-like protein 2 n=1 Tax=Psylliodes chrysocephalus TaxID=3402493 RepID=A0A9P0G930_9CUCU|nr:unnamed protein product [Psylliodes chrysocephala]